MLMTEQCQMWQIMLTSYSHVKLHYEMDGLVRILKQAGSNQEGFGEFDFLVGHLITLVGPLVYSWRRGEGEQ